MINVYRFDAANPNDIADQLRAIQFGALLQGQVTQVRRKADLSVAQSYNLATLGILTLPDNGKAAQIVTAYARAGGVALGPLTVAAINATPTTTQIAVTPSGDIACLLSDAYTSVDIIYTPERGDSNAVDSNGDVNNTSAPGNVFPVVSNVITLPSNLTTRGVILLTEAEALAGTSTGKKIILAPGAGAPAAGQCRLNLAKSTITFATADAVTRARVKLLLCATAAKDLATVLNAQATLI